VRAIGRGLAWFVATFVLATLLLYVPFRVLGAGDAHAAGRAAGRALGMPMFFGSIVAGFVAGRGPWRHAFAVSGVLFLVILALDVYLLVR
jgi:hypothetical protein